MPHLPRAFSSLPPLGVPTPSWTRPPGLAVRNRHLDAYSPHPCSTGDGQHIPVPLPVLMRLHLCEILVFQNI